MVFWFNSFHKPLCLLIGTFSPLTFKVVTERYVLTAIVSLVCCFLILVLLPLWCDGFL